MDPYSNCGVTIRGDLIAAHRATWSHLAQAGTWYTGAERVAIMAEVRNAEACRLCAARKAALSPYTVEGNHDHLGGLPDVLIEVLHRVRTDPARLTPSWFESVTADALTVGQYVEAIGILAQTVAIDTFTKGLGLAPLPLPTPVEGEPSGYIPDGLSEGEAWVPLIDPELVGKAESDLFPAGVPTANIRRAMTAVPAEVRNFFGLVQAQYLPGHVMRDFDKEIRAINHAQIELVAGRVSAINGCVY